MISFKVNPSSKLKGLRYRWSQNEFAGSLYTAMPLRIITARRNALIIFLISFFGPWESIPEFGGLLMIGCYPLALLYDPGKRIKLTHDALFIGIKRFDLSLMGPFCSIPMSEKKQHVHFLAFQYGTKLHKLPVKNRADHNGLIVQILNEARQSMLSEAPAADLDETATGGLRSAEF